MKNLLLVAPIFPPEIGGPATYTYKIAQRFKKRYGVRIIAFAEKHEKIKRVRITPLKIHYTYFGFFRRQLSLLWHLLKNIGWADVVYIQGPIVVGALSVLLCRIFGKPHAVKFVGDIAWETAFGSGKTEKFLDDFLAKPDAGMRSKLLLFIQRRVFKNAQKIIVPSQYLQMILVKYYGVQKKNIEVIYNAIDFSLYKNLTKKKPAQKTIITVGRIVRWKNIGGIMRAVAKIPDVCLRIVGDGPDRKDLEQYAKEIRIENRVEFMGRVNHSQVLKLINTSDIFVLNSFYEGLPHVVIESLMCSCPTIATKIKGTNEIAVHNKTALTIPVDNDDALAEAIKRIYREPKLTERLKQTGKKFVEDRFSWEKNGKQLEKLLNSLK